MVVAEAETLVMELVARQLALRELVVQLIACEAQRRDDPRELLRILSTAMDKRLDHDQDQSISLLMKEIVRAESDWVVKAAEAAISKGTL